MDGRAYRNVADAGEGVVRARVRPWTSGHPATGEVSCRFSAGRVYVARPASAPVGEPGQPGFLADLSLHMPDGVYRFTAWMEPWEDDWEVRPCAEAEVEQRRGVLRVPLDAPATLKEVGDDGRILRGSLLDLSPRGAGVQIALPMPVGQQVELAIENCPWEGMLPLAGNVAHCTADTGGAVPTFRVGVRLHSLPAGVVEGMVTYLWQRLRSRSAGDPAPPPMARSDT